MNATEKTMQRLSCISMCPAMVLLMFVPGFLLLYRPWYGNWMNAGLLAEEGLLPVRRQRPI